MRVVLRPPHVAALVPAASGQGLVVSVVLHVAVVAGAVFAASLGGEPPQVLAVYVVEMITDPGPSSGAAGPITPSPPAEPEPRQEQASPPPPEPEPEPAPAVKPPPKKPPEKPKARTPPTEPKPKPAPAETHAVPDAVAPREAAPVEARPEPGSGDGTGVGLASGAPGDGGGIPTIDSQAFPFAYYRRIMQARLTAAWARPIVPHGLGAPIRTTVHFQIRRGGLITDIETVSSSGYVPLDRSALRAVQDANPLPPLPEEFDGDRLSVNFYLELTPGG